MFYEGQAHFFWYLWSCFNKKLQPWSNKHRGDWFLLLVGYNQYHETLAVTTALTYWPLRNIRSQCFFWSESCVTMFEPNNPCPKLLIISCCTWPTLNVLLLTDFSPLSIYYYLADAFTQSSSQWIETSRRRLRGMLAWEPDKSCKRMFPLLCR